MRCVRTPSSQIRRLSTLDSTWVTNSSNGLQGHAHPHWLHVYLATCKLLHVALSLPATRLPQFQMYRWAFVGDEVVRDGDISSAPAADCSLPLSTAAAATTSFIPYLCRIYRLLKTKVFPRNFFVFNFICATNSRDTNVVFFKY